MCEPTTMIAIGSAALAGTQSVVGYMGASADAAAQTAHAQRSRRESIAAYGDDIEALQLDQSAAQEDATSRRVAATGQGLAARSAARVSAGERGIGGFTAAAIQQDLGFAEGAQIAAIDRNAELDESRFRLGSRNAQRTATSRVNSVQNGRAPSMLALGASLGGAALSGYHMKTGLDASKAATSAYVNQGTA